MDVIDEYLKHGGFAGYAEQDFIDDMILAASDTAHPLHNAALALKKGDAAALSVEIKRNQKYLESKPIFTLARMQALQAELLKADEEADRLLKLATNGTLEDFYE